MYSAVPDFLNFETIIRPHACTIELRKPVLVLEPDPWSGSETNCSIVGISSEKSLLQPVLRSVTLREWMEETDTVRADWKA